MSQGGDEMLLNDGSGKTAINSRYVGNDSGYRGSGGGGGGSEGDGVVVVMLVGKMVGMFWEVSLR